VVVVGKRDGTKRFCVDFRQLNKITKPTSYPYPLLMILSLQNILQQDTSGFWQIPVHESDKEKTALIKPSLQFSCNFVVINASEGSLCFQIFTTFRGLFEFNRTPFGLVSAPGVFKELMSHAFKASS
jgi:hypothetical protein